MSKLLKNSIFYTLGNIIPKVTKFLLLPVYSIYMSPTDYGIVSAMMALQLVLQIFFTLSADRGVERIFYDDADEQRRARLMGTMSLFLTAVSLLMFGMCWGAQNWIMKLFPGVPTYPFFMYMLLATWGSCAAIIPKVYWRVTEQGGLFFSIALLEFFMQVALELVFVVWLKKGAEGFMIAGLLREAVFIPYYIWVMFRISSLSFDLKLLSGSLKICLPMVPTLLCAWLLNLSNRAFITRYVSVADLGLYSFASNLANTVIFLGTGFITAYGPNFYALANDAKLDPAEAKAKLFVCNRRFCLVVILCAAAIALFMQEFSLVTNRRYIDCYPMIPLIIFGNVFALFAGLLNLALYQQKKTVYLMYINIGAAFVNVALNRTLIPPWGRWGAALATVITMIGVFTATYIIARRGYFIPMAWTKLLPVAIFLIAATGLFYLRSMPMLFSIAGKVIVIIVALLYCLKSEKVGLRSLFKRNPDLSHA